VIFLGLIASLLDRRESAPAAKAPLWASLPVYDESSFIRESVRAQIAKDAEPSSKKAEAPVMRYVARSQESIDADNLEYRIQETEHRIRVLADVEKERQRVESIYGRPAKSYELPHQSVTGGVSF